MSVSVGASVKNGRISYKQNLNIPNILPVNQLEATNIAPAFAQPVNILAQQKSQTLTTNPFVDDRGMSFGDLNPAAKDYNFPDDTNGDRLLPTPKAELDQPTQLTTRAFISDQEKQNELDALQSEINKVVRDNYNHNITSSISKMSFWEVNKNIGQSCVDLLNDALNKPNGVDWFEYLQIILKKNQRYTYIGLLCIFIAVYVLIIGGGG